MKRVLCIVMILVIAVCACGCDGKPAVSDGKLTKDVNLYFSNADYNNIRSEKRTVAYTEDDVFAQLVVQELLEGPSDVTSKAVIPSGTRLLDFKTDGVIARLNFSSEYLNFEGDNSKSAELLARYSIVKTLCELPGIDKVDICVEGEALLNSSGNPLGPIGENDIVFDENSTENVTHKYVTLYFSDEMGEKLVPVRRRAPLVDNSMEKTIITELIKGPDSDRYYGTLPSDTKLLTVETKEKICFVNFSKEFVDKFSGGSTEATLAIYSVVNSLTELGDIQKVQFLVNGEKVEWFGDYAFSEPFERDEDIIGR
ncbi:MAG: GerMN domain-containing protein [Clostridia bacterium]|nr:GerMN domain-containing protein [Clostridia bacterium]